MDTVSLTYAALAERLGITVSSAKNTARRKGWTRTIGNDKRARVNVPVEALPGALDAGGGDAPRDTPSDGPSEGEGARALQAALTAALARAEAAERDRDRWAGLAADLRADLEAERRAARRSWWERTFGRAA